MGEEELIHYGTSLASGRFPKGSGEDPYQHGDESFLSRVKQYKDKGLSQKEIAECFGMSINSYRAKLSAESNAKKRHDIELVKKLRDKGMSVTAIAERTGFPRTTIDGWIKEKTARNVSVLNNTMNTLKDEVSDKKYLMISSGAEVNLNISATRLNNAVKSLKEEGYEVHQLRIKELFTNNQRTITVLCPPGTTAKEVWEHRFDIRPPTSTTDDGGETFRKAPKPKDIKQFDSKRVMVKYAEDGGEEKDGVIELRRNVEGLSLGGATYAQVRIGVDGTHYLKGMAVYADDLPEGIDIRFNTNKHKGTPMLGDKDNTVLKPQKSDKDNPFGAEIQSTTARGYGEYLNIVNEEGNWANWSKTLASQFLSKQPVSIAKKQLQLAYAESIDEYEEIKSLTNPTIKKQLLQEFADSCDSKSVHLKAAALPRQATHVILPVESLSEKEIFAPRYKDGEEVILIRYPHGGIFEIPRLKVNNRNREARKVIGTDAEDAVGINKKVANVLSGADFDGDTVLVIPTKGLKLKTKEPLEALKNFDPKAEYPKYEGMKVVSKQYGYTQMGVITNLITDMQVKGASEDELVRAIKHSMVTIDANKHELDFKRSFKENRIAELQEKYQPSPEGSRSHKPSTLFSRAKNPVNVTYREEQYNYDPETGEKLYTVKQKVKKDFKTGKMVEQTTKTNQMAETKDAYTLSSGTAIENAYADYANKMKALANSARKEYMATPNLKYSPEAYKRYSDEVASLNHKLNIALKNRPLENLAFLIAKQTVTNKIHDNPGLMDDADALKKEKSRAIKNAREIVGAKKEAVTFTDKEWEAVQAGAISSSKLTDLIRNTKSDDLKKLAMPKEQRGIPDSKIQRAKQYRAAGWTWDDISEKLGYSSSSLIKAVNKKE